MQEVSWRRIEASPFFMLLCDIVCCGRQLLEGLQELENLTEIHKAAQIYSKALYNFHWNLGCKSMMKPEICLFSFFDVNVLEHLI